MGILDDAIRDHLELKKLHGAPDRELRQLEDEALGPGDQPDPFTGSGLFEGLEGGGSARATASEPPPRPAAGSEEVTRIVDEAAAPPPPDVAEPPSPSRQEVDAGPAQGPALPDEVTPAPAAPETPPEIPTPPVPSEEPDTQTAARRSEPAPPPREVDPSELESLDTLAEGDTVPRPAAEEPPAPEATAPPESAVTIPPPPPEGHEERAESLSAPAEEAGGGPEPVPTPTDFDQAPAAPSPADSRPGISDIPTQEHPPPEPPSQAPPAEGEAWPEAEVSEPAPEPAQEVEPQLPEAADELDQGPAPAIYDFETDEELAEPAPVPEPPSDEFESPASPEPDDERPAYDDAELERDSGDERQDDDLLSASPDFIDEESEGEDLWFEKRPPEDFDFEEDR